MGESNTGPGKNGQQEAKAIEAVISALAPLEKEKQNLVINYVIKRFALSSGGLVPSPPLTEGTSPSHLPRTSSPPTDIRSLKETKAPRNSVEMTALVAFYLSEVAPAGDKRQTIGTNEIESYFKQAGFPLPPRPRDTLTNAKNAGYLDAVGRGEYKLNPVVYNLVMYILPAGDQGPKKRGSVRRKISRSNINKGQAKRTG